MSYILDALKKSEAERSRGVVPTLLTPPQTTFRSSIIGWGLMAALVINAGLFAAWLYWPRGVAPTTTMRTAEPTPVAASTTAAPSTATPTAAPFSAAAPQQDTGTEPESPLETAVTRQANPVAPPTPTHRAPVADTDSGAADLSFSTHVYATDPSMRAVTMNGRRFVEGDEVRPGVRIREITETGVILDVNGRPIPVDVLQDWR